MIWSRRRLSLEVRALLDRERVVPSVPGVVRARSLARARAALAAGEASPAVVPSAAPRTRWAVAAALVCVASAAVGAAVHVHPTPAPTDQRISPVDVVAAPVVALAPPSVPVAPIGDVPAPAGAMAAPRATTADVVRAELRLLRQARAAVARADFAAALPPIAEHARRFKHGRLVEEREALRVKALAGLGRTDESRRAAASFQARFPKSVLSPAVGRMAAPKP